MSRIVVGAAWIVRQRRLLTGLIQPPAQPLTELRAPTSGRGDIAVALDVVTP